MPNPPTYPADKPRAIAQQLFQCADDNWLQIMDPTRQFDYATMPTMWDVMAEADAELETEAGQPDAFRHRPPEPWPADLRAADIAPEIGSTPCRERGGRYVENPVGPGPI